MDSQEPDSSLAMQAALMEFQKLRDEISGRTNNQWVLVGLNITGAGFVAGLAIARPQASLLLLLLPIVTPSLGMLFLDHALTILRIGRYIDESIVPVVRECANRLDLMSHEERIYEKRRGIARSLVLFGIPLVLLFNAVPIAALIILPPHLFSGVAWLAWSVGLLLTITEVGLWIYFLGQPFRRGHRVATPRNTGGAVPN